MNNKVLWVVSSIVILGFLTVVYLATNSSSGPQSFSETKTVVEGDHIKWSKDKKHVLTEYADIQCPACGLFHEYIKENIETNKLITDNVTFLYKHFPLAMHKNAEAAAYAAEAAGIQGKFFEMIDLQFAKQSEWENLSNTDEYFQKLATQLKLDIDKFKTDMKSSAVKERVKKDLESGRRVQVNSTPSFFLDGKEIDAKSLDQFKKLLEDTAKQEKMVE